MHNFDKMIVITIGCRDTTFIYPCNNNTIKLKSPNIVNVTYGISLIF